MLVAGLISGTSVDGIDVALVDIQGSRIRPLAHRTFPYPPSVREAILGISNAPTHTAHVARANFLVGELFAEAVQRACWLSRIPIHRLGLIGSHGQTIYHQGNPQKYLGR